MNLLAHHVKKIYSVEDITKEFEKRTGLEAKERLYCIDMDVACYGKEERVKQQMYETEYKCMQENGFYMA